MKKQELARFHLRFEAALSLATRLHAGQVRKGTAIPYISHLLAVASLVMEQGGDEDQAIAALLHDAVEDQGGRPTLATIRQRFGDRVAAIVEGCSDSDRVPRPAWKERKQQYLAHLERASSDVRLVSCADKLHNARAIVRDFRVLGDALWGRFNAGKADILWYYRELAKAFKRAGTSPLVEEFDTVVTELEAISQRVFPEQSGGADPVAAHDN